MKQLLTYFKTVDRIWLVIWTFIYSGFISLDFLAPSFFGVTLLKLLGVAICTLYVIVNFTKDRLLVIAFSLTFLADILLAINNTSTFGILTFIIAQFFHFSRLRKSGHKFIAVSLCVISAYFILAILTGKHSIYLLGTMYAFFLIANLLLSFRWHDSAKKSNHALCAFYGFALFFLCDFCVAGSFFSVIHVLPFALKRIFDFMAWFFYFPSQVLLSNSSKKIQKNKEISNVLV